MSIPERRQIENEMIYRRANEKVGDSIEAIDQMHIADDNPELITGKNLPLHFMCECSDEKCADRIPMKLDEYQKIHADRDTFIVLPNHQVDLIETVVSKKSKYTVVKKNKSTAEPGNVLNSTTVNNT